MKDVLFLAWCYLRFNRGKTSVLIASMSLILFLPAGMQVVVRHSAEMLTARADDTPLLMGAPGSAVDLTLSALYFREPSLEPIVFGRVEEVDTTSLATGIPLHLRFVANGHRIVGTTPDYLDFRGLEIASGRSFALLGECILGSAAASDLGVTTGDHLLSTPAGAFDVAGSFPLKMKVVGVLQPNGTPDDEVVLVDVKTAWVIAGHAHGHMDMVDPASESGVLERSDSNIVANAAVLSHTEITPENINSFHFHGDPAGFPIDAVIAAPLDRKSQIVLRGRYADGNADVQLVVPRAVIDDLVETMFSVRDVVLLVSVGLGAATVATAILVFALSLRIRRREILTIRRIGGTRKRLLAILATEILLVIFAAATLAGILTLLVSRHGDLLIRVIAG